MQHSQNKGQVIDESFGGEGVTLKVYIYDETNRFVTMGSVALTMAEIQQLAIGVARRRAELTQPRLFE